MFIQSKLLEIDTDLLRLALPDQKDNRFYTGQFGVNGHTGVEASASVYYNRDGCMIETKFRLEREITDAFYVEGDYVQLSFTGEGFPQFWQEGSLKDIETGIVQICYQRNHQARIQMAKGAHINYFGIFLSRGYFLNLLKNEPWALESTFFQSVQNKEIVPFGQGGRFPVNALIYQLLSEVKRMYEAGLEDKDKHYYTGLKLKELFLNAYILKKSKERISEKTSFRMVDQMKKAKAILTARYMAPPTIKELSRMLSLNELKLKKGFKSLYGTTIRGFVIQLRMQMAKSFLMEGKAVGEVSELLGYNNVSFFINTFKKYYGQTPKQAIKSGDIHELEFRKG